MDKHITGTSGTTLKNGKAHLTYVTVALTAAAVEKLRTEPEIWTYEVGAMTGGFYLCRCMCNGEEWSAFYRWRGHQIGTGNCGKMRLLAKSSPLHAYGSGIQFSSDLSSIILYMTK
jgi:hypothetical protein